MLGVVESEKSANVTLLVFGNSRIDSGYIKSGNGMVLSSKFLSHNSHRKSFYRHGLVGSREKQLVEKR